MSFLLRRSVSKVVKNHFQAFTHIGNMLLTLLFLLTNQHSVGNIMLAALMFQGFCPGAYFRLSRSRS